MKFGREEEKAINNRKWHKGKVIFHGDLIKGRGKEVLHRSMKNSCYAVRSGVTWRLLNLTVHNSQLKDNQHSKMQHWFDALISKEGKYMPWVVLEVFLTNWWKH